MQGFDFEELFFKFRYPLAVFLLGLILLTAGILAFKSGFFLPETKVEILNESAGISQTQDEITAEIAGSIARPGVYKLREKSRVEDLLVASGGFSADADRSWADKNLNRAAKLTDGQKVYIPKVNERSDTLSAKIDGRDQTISSTFSSDSTALININTASLSQLDTLPGIGPVYGQSIIDHRPYSTREELLSKGALKKNIYEKIKDRITVY